MNPFSEIEVTPLFSKDGMRSQGKSVRIQDEDSSTGRLMAATSTFIISTPVRRGGLVVRSL